MKSSRYKQKNNRNYVRKKLKVFVFEKNTKND